MHISFRFLLFFSFWSLWVVPEVSGQPLFSGRLESGQDRDPVLRADGRELFFTRTAYPGNKGKDNAADIWVCTRYADGSWGRVLNPGAPINSFAHDRALSLNADGSRLAVFRQGITDHLEILGRDERNWRILASWVLPEGIAPRYDLTFDFNRQCLIYSAYSGEGKLDLYERQALADGRWAAARPLHLLNSGDNEHAPQMAADGRALYFQRDDRWWLRAAAGEAARAVTIPADVRQFTVAMTGNEGVCLRRGAAHLEATALPAAALPPPGGLQRGYLRAPLLPGEVVATVPLRTGATLTVAPDALARYAVYLREGEQLAVDAATASEAVGGAAAPQRYAARRGGTAAVPGLSPDFAPRVPAPANARTRQTLDNARREYAQGLTPAEDPELEQLRARLARSRQPVADSGPTSGTDTLPPPGSHAAKVAELERLKARFRKQQEDKLRQTKSTQHTWTGERTDTLTAPDSYGEIPSIGESYTPLNTVAREQRRQEDSIALIRELRQELSHSPTPGTTMPAAWQRGLRKTQPRSGLVGHSPEPPARRAPAAATPAAAGVGASSVETAAQKPSAWTVKGGQSPAYVPAVPPPPAAPGDTRTFAPLAVSFIPDTAYPDSRGYVALDTLIDWLKADGEAVSIRVHTSPQLSRRVAQLLSEERATSIREYLLENGVSRSRFEVTGYGNHLTGTAGERVDVSQ